MSDEKEDLTEEEVCVKGAPVSEGIAIGVPVFLSSLEKEVLPDFPITINQVEHEIARYRRALSSSREDLRLLQANLAREGSMEVVSIIDTHIQMLDDPMMTTNIENKIGEMLKNTESVFHSVISDYEKKFSLNPDAFFQQRLSDVRDLSRRVLRNLCPSKKINFEAIPQGAIVFAKELIPSDTASIQASRVKAFVTDLGGGTSHTALIARAKGIPYVSSVDVEMLQKAQGKFVIVDGLTGNLIFNPKESTLKKYEKLQHSLSKRYELLERDRILSSETIDGYPINIFANISEVSEMEAARLQGACGIGLFRSEYLFLDNSDLLYDEEAQYTIYKELLKASTASFVMRVMDLGGEKCPRDFKEIVQEPNPVLGSRGIRFLMRHKAIFRTQLRAALRAGIFGDLRLLLPLVSDIHELRQVKLFIEEVKVELRSEGVNFKEVVPLGCMLEVPSSVLICDCIAQESDFLAIGTNDLIQYSLGVDRSNPSMSDFYYPTHPSVLRMVKMILLEAKRQMRSVTICGEVASNPLFIPMLIGLGVRNFSCSPRFIPIIKRTIRKHTLVEMCQISEKVLTFKTSAEITHYLLDRLDKSFKDN